MKNKKLAGIFFILGILAGGTYVLNALLPMLISLSADSVYIVFLLITLAGLTYLIFKALRYFFK